MQTLTNTSLTVSEATQLLNDRLNNTPISKDEVVNFLKSQDHEALLVNVKTVTELSNMKALYKEGSPTFKKALEKDPSHKAVTIHKVSIGNVIMGLELKEITSIYEEMKKKKFNADQVSIAKPSWKTFSEFYCLAHYKDDETRNYLNFIFLSASNSVYFIDGKLASKEEVEQYTTKSKPSKSDPDAIPYRHYSLENVLEITPYVNVNDIQGYTAA